ncbi:hypothetical protein BRC62_02255 [Halobacteriales archaeon QH_10_67_13]|nr:MAG: hypothetical protein BRC62_02255 [Halobacteriales archaeon QH_10_67_13]
MTSLTDIYGGGVGAAVPRWRRRVGAAAVAAGVAMVVLALAIAAGPAAEWLGHSDARSVAGVLAGLGLPVALLGVLLAVIGVYAVGVLVTIWCLFVGVATLSRRRRPGETARVAVTDRGTIELVRSPGDGGGSVGLIGSAPTGRGTASTGDAGGREPRATADGAGTESRTTSAPIGPDSYCGNCAHFEYVRADGELTPYCHHHDRLIEDMTACEAWTGGHDQPESSPTGDDR